MTLLVSFVLSLGILAVLPYSVVAQEGAVLINEIAWMGTPTMGVEEKQWWRYEWIELYNAGDIVGMLDGWTVELSREKLDFTIPLSGIISAHGYFLIGASDKILNLDLNYNNLGGKFNNSGQRVVLKNASGEIVDEVDVRNGWLAGDNKTKQTMERVGQDWQTSADPGGTPKAPNSEGVTVDSSLTKSSYPLFDLVKDTQGQTEKDLAGSSLSIAPDSEPNLVKDTKGLEQFQSRVPIVNPITLLAGLLALGFSGALLLARRLLASRQERHRLEHPERSRRT